MLKWHPLIFCDATAQETKQLLQLQMQQTTRHCNMDKQFNFTTEQEDALAQASIYEEQMQMEADVWLDILSAE